MAELVTRRNLTDILKTSQQKAVSTGILTFALLVALLWGSFRPTLITIIETNRKMQEKKETLTFLETQNTNLTSLISQQQELQDKLKPLDYFFPSDGDYSLFVTNLHQIAKNYSLELSSISFSDNYFRQVEKLTFLQFKSMRPVTFQATLRGDSFKIAQFLAYIESTPFLPKVISISYSPNKTKTTDTTISATFLLYKMSTQAGSYE